MIDKHPAVTVLMPVYNGERYILEAVKSVLGQSYTDFELLVIDDCSSDSSVAILEAVTDPRMILVSNTHNMGLAATLNRGISLAKGTWIARMDQDDIAHRERLRLQVDFMERHPDVAVCGCGVEVFYVHGGTHRHYFPLSYDAVKVEALFNSPVSHPGAMIRKEVLIAGAYQYDEAPNNVEDYDLFSRLSHQYPIVNLPYFLLRYRVSGYNETMKAEAPERAAIRKEAITRVQATNLAKAGIQPTARQLDLHYLLSLTARIQQLNDSTYSLNEIKAYLYHIRKQIVRTGFAHRSSAAGITGKVFLKVVIYNARLWGLRKGVAAICSRMLWDGIWHLLALRGSYLLKIKRI